MIEENKSSEDHIYKDFTTGSWPDYYPPPPITCLPYIALSYAQRDLPVTLYRLINVTMVTLHNTWKWIIQSM